MLLCLAACDRALQDDDRPLSLSEPAIRAPDGRAGRDASLRRLEQRGWFSKKRIVLRWRCTARFWRAMRCASVSGRSGVPHGLRRFRVVRHVRRRLTACRRSRLCRQKQAHANEYESQDPTSRSG